MNEAREMVFQTEEVKFTTDAEIFREKLLDASETSKTLDWGSEFEDSNTELHHYEAHGMYAAVRAIQLHEALRHEECSDQDAIALLEPYGVEGTEEEIFFLLNTSKFVDLVLETYMPKQLSVIYTPLQMHMRAKYVSILTEYAAQMIDHDVRDVSNQLSEQGELG